MFKKQKRFLIFFCFFFIIALFCYFRLKPIYFQTVGYTYDQGRDFLKAAEIVLYKNPTFIGPTTGIMGIYHGAWWYYAIAIPFLLFGGLPISFYYFNFFVHLFSLIVFFLFAKKFFGTMPAIICSFIITLSSYFIFTSTFVGNNIFAIPSFMFFIITVFYLVEKKAGSKILLIMFLNGILLGMVTEFEFSFGLFLIPAYFLLITLFPSIRSSFLKIKNILLFCAGLGIAFLPRLLFELKNNFMQTKTLINFFIKPKLNNPKPFFDIIRDRFQLFIGYYKNVFPNDLMALLFAVIFLISIILIIKNKIKIYNKFLLFCITLLGILFLSSIFYKDNFWSNYYEGIQYIFVFCILIILSPLTKKHNFLFSHITKTLVIFLFLFSLFIVFQQIRKQPKFEGLAVQTKVVNYIHSQINKNKPYCVKIYTPPVIPYTYDYLFLYNRLSKKIPDPKKDWINNTCWFIIENDSYQFRINNWKEENIPKNALLKHNQKIQDVLIQLWKKS
jgi:hypothetical protein